MTVEYSEKKHFYNVMNGDIFILDDVPMMRVSITCDKYNTECPYNAILISNGQHFWIDLNTEIEIPRNTKLQIER